MAPFNYNAELYDVYIGNDVDQKSFALHIRERYREVMTKKISADPEQLYNFAKRQFPNQRVVIGYEAGPTGFGLHDYMAGRNMACVMISPGSVPKPTNQRVKTNKIDAKKISSMLAEGNFNPVRVPDGDYRELRNRVDLRQIYVQHQRATKQRIKALLLYTSLHTTCRDIEQNWSKRYIEHIKTIECTPAIRSRLDRLLEDLNYARRQLLLTTRELRIFCETTADIKDHMHNLKTIPGIGIIVAANVLGRIGDPKHLKSLRELSAFCGIVPRENSTGDKVRRGGITHLGNPKLRSLLVEAAWVAIKKDKELEQFFYRIVNKNTQAYAKQKAIVAVAHKLTHRIYRVLIERREYVIH
jgi:transposase